MLAKVVAVILVVFAGIEVQASSSSGFSYEEELVSLAKAKNLAKERQWENILFYRSQWLRPKKSFVVSSEFYLSQDGIVNAEEELTATIRAFFQPELPKPANEPEQVNSHPQCVFPSRFYWINKQLKFDFKRMKKVRCELVEDLVTDLEPESISFVFSSAYLNNPASMFGHTFLRVHRANARSKARSALLDYSINFAAYPDTEEPVSYAFKGTAGAFPGQFDLKPYFMKVQEYNSSENRDLWEYKLNFTPDETKQIVLSLFEVSRERINYYYLDDNCALMMLVLLEIGRPSLELVSQYKTWVIPADTVKTVVDYPGLVESRSFRPSNLTRFIGKYKTLDDAEQDSLKSVLDKKNETSAREHLAAHSPSSKAKIIDTALDFIDFKEKITENKKPVLYANLREPLLKMRAETRAAGAITEDTPVQADPATGHDSTRFAISSGTASQYGNFNRIEWRPALHDIMTPSLGYADELEIRFMDIDVQYNWNKDDVYLSRFQLFEVISLAPLKPLLTDWSWRLSLGMETEVACASSERCFRKFIQFGRGVSIKPIPNVLFYALAVVDVGSTNQDKQTFHGGPGVFGGATWGPTQNIKLALYGNYLAHFGGKTVTDWKLGVESSYIFAEDFEVRLRGIMFTENEMAMISLAKYF